MTDNDQVLADFVREFGPDPYPLETSGERCWRWRDKLEGYRAAHAAMEKKLAARSAVKEANEYDAEITALRKMVEEGYIKPTKDQKLILANADRIATLTHAVQTLREALTEVLATYRSTCRPPDTIEKAEEHLQRIRAASELGNKALSSTAGVVKR